MNGSVRASERRCPNCRALVAEDASWCGQCYADLRPAEDAASADPIVEPDPPSGPVIEDAVTDAPEAPAAPGPAPGWPCPACEAWNPIALDTCASCGTPFAALMRQGADRGAVSTRDAVTWSLVFPGLGHRLVGRPLDGFARGVLFAVCFAMAVLLGLGGVSAGPTVAAFAVFLLAGLIVYVGSALEAQRLAAGGDLLVSSRVLLWVLAAVILLAVVALGFAAVRAGRDVPSAPQAIATAR